jgi:outer membrane protein assembly factor BamB
VVYIGSKNTHFYALDAKTGAELWKFQVEDWAVTDPVVAGGAVLFGVGNNDNREGPRTLYALDATTGEELWTFQARGRLLTAVAVADDRVFVASTSGQVYALE